MPELRVAVPDDYPQLSGLLDTCFEFEPGQYCRTFAAVWAPDAVEWEHTFVIVEGPRVVAAARLFVLDLVLGEAGLHVAGLGDVATLPEARGQGHMTVLVNHVCDRARDEGFPAIVLTGDRHRYGRFGFENAGRQVHLRLQSRGLRAAGITPLAPSVFDGQPGVLESLAAAYARHEFRRRRTLQDNQAVLVSRPDITTHFAGEGDTFGYLTLKLDGGSPTVMEYGGAAETWLRLAAHTLDTTGARWLTFPHADEGVAHPLALAAASWWSAEPSCMLRILDLDATVQAFAPQSPGLCPGDFTGLREVSAHEQVRTLFPAGERGPFSFFWWPLDEI